MKTKNFLTNLASLIGAITSFIGIAVANNTNNQITLNKNVNVNKIKKTLDATLIGAQKGTFTIEYSNVNHCEIVSVDEKFTAYGYFNFNGGHFTVDRVTYTITAIGNLAFFHKYIHFVYFHDVYLTIPSTIKKIEKKAFAECRGRFSNKGIVAINFEEGIEYIGEEAFGYCVDIKQKYIKLPNSLKTIENRAFINTKIEVIDLSALDHVIENSSLNEEKVDTNTLKKIYVKSEKLKEEYLKAKSWRLTPEVFEVKEVPPTPTPDTKLTIDARLIGGDAGDVTLDVKDPNNSIILNCDHDFLASANFNFNNCHFTVGGVAYTITGIDKKVFHHNKRSFRFSFTLCYLTIPSTIKYIGEEAFYNNSRIVGQKEIIRLNFEEGIEFIGKSAFEKCKDIKQETLKLPNSLKRLGNRAFVNTGALKYFDLTALDHVIDIDCNPLSKNGCLPTKQIKKIYFKDEATKNLYLSDKYWKSCAKYFEVK